MVSLRITAQKATKYWTSPIFLRFWAEIRNETLGFSIKNEGRRVARIYLSLRGNCSAFFVLRAPVQGGRWAICLSLHHLRGVLVCCLCKVLTFVQIFAFSILFSTYYPSCVTSRVGRLFQPLRGTKETPQKTKTQKKERKKLRGAGRAPPQAAQPFCVFFLWFLIFSWCLLCVLFFFWGGFYFWCCFCFFSGAFSPCLSMRLPVTPA